MLSRFCLLIEVNRFIVSDTLLVELILSPQQHLEHPSQLGMNRMYVSCSE